jgi:hypothetical protein
VSKAGPRVKFIETAAPRGATVMVYGLVPPDIFSGRTSQVVMAFVVLVVIDIGEIGLLAWHAVPDVEAGTQNVMAGRCIARTP